MFLVGDAAPAWPPTGSLGANAGIQDGHNLAWKLAAVLRGTRDRRCWTPTTMSDDLPVPLIGGARSWQRRPTGAPISTLDLYGKRLALLAGGEGRGWVSVARSLDASPWTPTVSEPRSPRPASVSPTPVEQYWSGRPDSSPGAPPEHPPGPAELDHVVNAFLADKPHTVPEPFAPGWRNELATYYVTVNKQ